MMFLYDLYLFFRRIMCIKGHIFELKLIKAVGSKRVKVYECMVCFKNVGIVDEIPKTMEE